MDAVVFDWDGTLVDTLGALFRANVAMLGEYGIPFDEATYRRHYSGDWRVMYRRLGIPPERLDEANERWLDHYSGGAEVQPFPGSLEALERLRATGASLGLVTAGHRAIVEPQLAATGLGALLPVRVFGDDLPVHKPDPEPLRVALARIGLADRPERAVYLGDAPDDMRMARAVGVRAVGIASILGDPGELLAAGAVEVAASLGAWVAKWLRDAERDPAVTRPAPSA
jgi:HAD superfamily hydrolase (TIGR01509 family)